MLKQLFAIIATVCLFAPLLMARGPQRPMRRAPSAERSARDQNTQAGLSLKEVQNLIKKNQNNQDVVFKTLEARGVDFDIDRKIEEKLRKAGADNIMLEAIWRAGPTGRTAKAASLTTLTGRQLQGTYEEGMGFKAIEDELDPGRKLSMVAEFEKRFPESQLLPYVYVQAAKAYQQEGDMAKVCEYGEKSLKLDPDNIFALLMVAITLPQPRMLPGNPAADNKQLTQAQTYADRALKLIDSVPSQPNETPEQLQQRKDSLASDAHAALAMVAMERDDTGKAAEELKTAISLAQKPNPQLYFRLGEVYANEGKNQEAIEAFTKAAQLGQGTILQKYADDRIQALKK